jgi:serine/threonine protein kinase
MALQVKYAVNTETGEKVAIKILDKEKIQKQNMGAQIKKEVCGLPMTCMLRFSGSL